MFGSIVSQVSITGQQPAASAGPTVPPRERAGYVNARPRQGPDGVPLQFAKGEPEVLREKPCGFTSDEAVELTTKLLQARTANACKKHLTPEDPTGLFPVFSEQVRVVNTSSEGPVCHAHHCMQQALAAVLLSKGFTVSMSVSHDVYGELACSKPIKVSIEVKPSFRAAQAAYADKQDEFEKRFFAFWDCKDLAYYRGQMLDLDNANEAISAVQGVIAYMRGETKPRTRDELQNAETMKRTLQAELDSSAPGHLGHYSMARLATAHEALCSRQHRAMINAMTSKVELETVWNEPTPVARGNQSDAGTSLLKNRIIPMRCDKRAVLAAACVLPTEDPLDTIEAKDLTVHSQTVIAESDTNRCSVNKVELIDITDHVRRTQEVERHREELRRTWKIMGTVGDFEAELETLIGPPNVRLVSVKYGNGPERKVMRDADGAAFCDSELAESLLPSGALLPGTQRKLPFQIVATERGVLARTILDCAPKLELAAAGEEDPTHKEAHARLQRELEQYLTHIQLMMCLYKLVSAGAKIDLSKAARNDESTDTSLMLMSKFVQLYDRIPRTPAVTRSTLGNNNFASSAADENLVDNKPWNVSHVPKPRPDLNKLVLGTPPIMEQLTAAKDSFTVVKGQRDYKGEDLITAMTMPVFDKPLGQVVPEDSRTHESLTSACERLRADLVRRLKEASDLAEQKPGQSVPGTQGAEVGATASPVKPGASPERMERDCTVFHRTALQMMLVLKRAVDSHHTHAPPKKDMTDLVDDDVTNVEHSNFLKELGPVDWFKECRLEFSKGREGESADPDDVVSWFEPDETFCKGLLFHKEASMGLSYLTGKMISLFKEQRDGEAPKLYPALGAAELDHFASNFFKEIEESIDSCLLENLHTAKMLMALQRTDKLASAGSFLFGGNWAAFRAPSSGLLTAADGSTYTNPQVVVEFVWGYRNEDAKYKGSAVPKGYIYLGAGVLMRFMQLTNIHIDSYMERVSKDILCNALLSSKPRMVGEMSYPSSSSIQWNVFTMLLFYNATRVNRICQDLADAANYAVRGSGANSNLEDLLREIQPQTTNLPWAGPLIAACRLQHSSGVTNRVETMTVMSINTISGPVKEMPTTKNKMGNHESFLKSMYDGVAVVDAGWPGYKTVSINEVALSTALQWHTRLFAGK